jgi:hypothetical protein
MSRRTFTDQKLDALPGKLRAYAKDQGGWLDIDDTCEDAADAIAFLRAEREATRKALDAAHYYIDAHDNELKERGMTREDALDVARELQSALPPAPEESK